MSNVRLTDEGEEKLKGLPFIMRATAKYLMESLNSLINGDCNEENVASTLGTLHQNAKGKICDADVMNYDEVGKALGFGTTNRMAMKKLLDKHNIKQIKINNMCCGFLRTDIMALKDKINEDVRKREIRRENRIK